MVPRNSRWNSGADAGAYPPQREWGLRRSHPKAPRARTVRTARARRMRVPLARAPVRARALINSKTTLVAPSPRQAPLKSTPVFCANSTGGCPFLTSVGGALGVVAVRTHPFRRHRGDGVLYASVVPRRCPPFTRWATGWVDPMQPPPLREATSSLARPLCRVCLNSLLQLQNIRYGDGGWGEHRCRAPNPGVAIVPRCCAPGARGRGAVTFLSVSIDRYVCSSLANISTTPVRWPVNDLLSREGSPIHPAVLVGLITTASGLATRICADSLRGPWALGPLVGAPL
eukprot:4914982-Pleurochrysis_carterae.AAC.1